MTTDNIEIRKNNNTDGYCCDFSINNKKFYADISNVMFCGSECMIFEYDKDDKIDWSGVYVNRDVDVSEESLLQCIKEFKEQYEPDKKA